MDLEMGGGKGDGFFGMGASSEVLGRSRDKSVE